MSLLRWFPYHRDRFKIHLVSSEASKLTEVSVCRGVRKERETRMQGTMSENAANIRRMDLPEI